MNNREFFQEVPSKVAARSSILNLSYRLQLRCNDSTLLLQKGRHFVCSYLVAIPCYCSCSRFVLASPVRASLCIHASIPSWYPWRGRTHHRRWISSVRPVSRLVSASSSSQCLSKICAHACSPARIPLYAACNATARSYACKLTPHVNIVLIVAFFVLYLCLYIQPCPVFLFMLHAMLRRGVMHLYMQWSAVMAFGTET